MLTAKMGGQPDRRRGSRAPSSRRNIIMYAHAASGPHPVQGGRCQAFFFPLACQSDLSASQLLLSTSQPPPPRSTRGAASYTPSLTSSVCLHNRAAACFRAHGPIQGLPSSLGRAVRFLYLLSRPGHPLPLFFYPRRTLASPPPDMRSTRRPATEVTPQSNPRRHECFHRPAMAHGHVQPWSASRSVPAFDPPKDSGNTLPDATSRRSLNRGAAEL